MDYTYVLGNVDFNSKLYCIILTYFAQVHECTYLCLFWRILSTSLLWENTSEYSTFTSMMQHVLYLSATVAHKQMKQPLQCVTLIVIATAETDRQYYIDHLLGTSGYYVVHIASWPCTSIYFFFTLNVCRCQLRSGVNSHVEHEIGRCTNILMSECL